MEINLRLNKNEVIKTIELAQIWDNSEFGTIHENEFELLEKLSKIEIVLKTKERFYIFNYSNSELLNISKSPFSVDEIELYKSALKENEDKKYNVLFNFIAIVHSNITKFESKILLKLLTLEMNESKKFITQSDLLTAYNNEFFDEDPDFDKSIKQSQLSRALKNLKKDKFIRYITDHKDTLITINWDNFRVKDIT